MDRFWDKVGARHADPDACWEWQAAKERSGYGAFKFGGKKTTASRASYIIEHGEIPDDMDVCHHCDNPGCVRPSHLFLGTRSDNMQDCKRKGRLVVPDGRPFEAGYTPHNSQLTENQVASIKGDLEWPQTLTVSEIARRHGVKRSVVADIKRGKTYRG